jgi:hypothetical protein
MGAELATDGFKVTLLLPPIRDRKSRRKGSFPTEAKKSTALSAQHQTHMS